MSAGRKFNQEDIDEIIPKIHGNKATVVWFTNGQYYCSCGGNNELILRE